MRLASLVAACGLAVFLPGCATAPRDPAAREAFKANNDPLEPLNRKVFAFNEAIDRFIIKPVAQGYVRIVPRAGRDGILNFLKNLNEPVVFANDAFQFEGRRAAITAGRFVLNSTLGVAGFVDFAGKHGLVRQNGDFGQTLHVWGFQEGPYLILPLWGPSNPRDAIGSGVDIYLVPYRYIADRDNYPSGLSAANTGLGGIDERSRNIDALDELQRESIDYYASFRSLYRQHRAAEVERGAAPATPTDDLYSDPGAPEKPGGVADKPKTS
jgi:phospholipid-binding lipoprotein MlaA